jgi:serine/threonine protein phosphatase PrpC
MVAVESYGASRTQDGSRENQDAFWIWRPSGSAAVVCDGAGRAQNCAASVVTLFGRQLESGALAVDRFLAWSSWLKTIDASLLGGPQTTFVGAAMVDDRLLGACAGDSRVYLVNESGVHILNETSSPRLGSGQAEPSPIHVRLAPRDVVLLMSDGAWTPLSFPVIHRTVVAHTMKHASEMPSALLDLAGARGRADDMTVVSMHRRR